MAKLRDDDVNWITQTARDPNGRVFSLEGNIYRAIYTNRVEFVKDLLRSRVVTSLMASGSIVETEACNIEIDGYGLVLKHKALPFKSAPSEWPSKFIVDSSRLICEINISLIKAGLCLVDSHPWNIMPARKGRPRWIDFGSICDWSPSHASAMREFLQSYYFPIMTLAQRPSALRIVRQMFDHGGLTADEAAAFGGESGGDELRIPTSDVSCASHLAWWENIRRALSSLEIQLSSSSWQNYYGQKRANFFDYHLADSQLENAHKRVENIYKILKEKRRSKIVDLGSNEGFFSSIASKFCDGIFACDFDENAINEFYTRLEESPTETDFCLASYDLTKQNTFSYVYPPRGELVLGLALTHHLALSQSLSFDDIAALIRRHTYQEALVEFMPNGLHPMDALYPDLPEWYNLDNFVSAFGKHFSKIDVIVPTDEKRVLLRCAS